MTTLTINNRYLGIIENVYLYLFALYAMLGSINFTYGTKIITPVMWLCFLLGFCIIVYRILNYKKYYKMPGLTALILLFASICLSTVLNFRYSFKENAVLCIYWAIFFFIIYTRSEDKTSEEIKKDTERLAAVFICYITVAVLASFVLMAAGVSQKIITDTGDEIYRGFVIGRLWGVFLNPNSGAVSAAIASAFLVYFTARTKKKWLKALYIADIFVMFMYIAMSDSRTGAITNGIIFGVFSLSLLLYKTKGKKIWLKILSVFLAAVITVAGFLVPRQLKNVYNQSVVIINSLVGGSSSAENDLSDALIDRGYDLSDDVSNRRFDAWGGAVELFLDSPKTVIYGCSFKGFTEYAKQVQPENYLVNNDYMDFTTLDNEFFNILDAQGLIGIFAAVFLIFCVLKTIIKNYFLADSKYRLLIAVGLAAVVGLAAASMFGSVIFYHFSPNTVLFWFILGSVITLFRNSKRGSVNER